MIKWKRHKSLKQMLAAAILIAVAACVNSFAKPKDQPPSPTSKTERVSLNNPAPEPASANGSTIISPKPGEVVSSPFEFVLRNILVMDPDHSEIHFNLKNKDGSLIRSFWERESILPEPGKHNNHETGFMQFSCPKGRTGIFEVKAINLVYGRKKVTVRASVPIKFEPETSYVTLYFLNDKLSKGKSGSIVFPVERKNLLKKAGPKAAIEELLKGPTEQEKAAGYYTKINPGTRLGGLWIKKGVLDADFSKELEFCGNTPCPVDVGAPIYETLHQFCDIKKVNIYVDGRMDPFPSDPSYSGPP
jgi:hypothetical protein